MLRHPDSVSRVFVHYPLEMHRYSRRAAQALECATLQGAFDDMLVGLYGSQLDFSSNPWARLAEESGASDTTALRRCMTEESEHPRIARGKAVAEGLRLTGTPAVHVNGFLYPVSPKDSALERAFRAIQRGEDPPDARRSSTRKVEVEYLDRI